MVLSLVVIEKMEKLCDDYNGHYQGFFVTEKGTLCYKPDKESNSCYIVNTGEKFEYRNELVYRAYFEGGTRDLKMLQKSKGTFEDWERKTHPSYGMISFSRIKSNGGVSLFGSSIKHNNPIRMEIYHADVERGLNRDWFHANGKIAEIEMSQSQFAEAITSLNMGDGVPCTVVFTERDGKIPECDFVSKIEQFKGEFTDHLSGIKDNLDKNIKIIEELFESRKTLKKSDKEMILSAFYSVKQNIGSNAEFIVDSFNEQMDKTVTEAKGEIESFMQHQVQKLASGAISDTLKEGELPDKIENPITID